MKKNTLILLLILAYTSLKAQNNLFEELAKYKGEQFKAYSMNSDDGKVYFKDTENWFNIKIKNDKYGKGIGVDIESANGQAGYMERSYNPKYDRIDHYTQPAFTRSSSYNKPAIVMIDGILFTLTYTNKDLSSVDIHYVYVPKSVIEAPIKTDEGNKKKKGKFKSFLKKVSKKMINSRPIYAFLKHFKTREIVKTTIKEYVVKMHKKQKANPLNAQDKKRWQEVIDMKKKAEEEIAEYNRKFYASEKGQAQLKRLEENRRRSGSSSSSSSSSVGASAKVQIKYRNVGNNVMYVYYTKPNGSQGKGRITKGSSSWFTVKAGSSLYYTTDDNGNGRNKQFLVKSKTTGNAYVEK